VIESDYKEVYQRALDDLLIELSNCDNGIDEFDLNATYSGAQILEAIRKLNHETNT